MKPVSPLTTIITSLLFCAGIAAADTNLTVATTVGFQQGPWNYANGSLNTAYQYGVGDQTAPTVISASNGFRFLVGDSITISYSSGSVSANGSSPFNDALGYTNSPANNSSDLFHGRFPSYYMNPATYPINITELVGTFATSNGTIVGTPFAVGDLATVTIPSGAAQLQLGVNDNLFSDNARSWTIDITALAVPEPSSIAPRSAAAAAPMSSPNRFSRPNSDSKPSPSSSSPRRPSRSVVNSTSAA